MITFKEELLEELELLGSFYKLSSIIVKCLLAKAHKYAILEKDLKAR